MLKAYWGYTHLLVGGRKLKEVGAIAPMDPTPVANVFRTSGSVLDFNGTRLYENSSVNCYFNNLSIV